MNQCSRSSNSRTTPSPSSLRDNLHPRLLHPTKRADIPDQQVSLKHRRLAVIWRALLSCSVVTSAVIANQLGGPLLGGVASAFPAVYSSTLIITQRAMGLDFSRSITKPLLLSTGLTTIPYTTALSYLYLSLGLGLGTIIAYIAAIPFGYFAYRLEKWWQDHVRIV